MPTRYKYKALADDGVPHKGIMTAENRTQVVDYLKTNNFIPISIQAARDKQAFSLFGFIRGADYENLIIFTHNLSTMYRAGIPLLKALSIIKVGPEGSRFNYAINQLGYKVQSGKSLSQAMADNSDIFPRVYINSIAAGEESGKLEDILNELASMLETELEISRLVKSGLRYPIIVISFIVLAFIVLMVYVIPTFVEFYGSFGAELPLPTKMIIYVNKFFLEYWGIALVVIVAIVIGFKKLIGNKKGKLFIDRRILKLPILGNLIIKGNIARFSLMFRILFKSGLPIMQTLNILEGSIKNSMICVEIRKLEELFRRGSESELIREKSEFFPDLAKQMINIGLESGSLENMLYELGVHYTKEVRYISRQLTAIIEPILTLVISVFVLILALAIFLPMWNLIKVFNPG